MFMKSRSRPSSVDEIRTIKEHAPGDEIAGNNDHSLAGRILAFLEKVVSDAGQTKNLRALVFAVAIGASLIIAACALPVLAFEISGAAGVAAVCGSCVSVAAAVAAIARIVKGFRRRK
jgi:hypothetical protein